MPATDDEIREKYLERAIRELNQLTREIQDCEHCPRGNLMPVLGSGHPQADIMLLKFAPVPSEIEEGVAFYGRAGSALMKSFKRLGIDPLAVYGTVFVKCPVHDTDDSAPECRARVLEEIAIVQPRIVVVMGDEALEELNGLGVPLGRELEPKPGEVQRLTPSFEALSCRTSTARSTTSRPSASSGRRSGRSASGTRTSLRTSRNRVLQAWPTGHVCLVVANRTAESPELLEALRNRTVQGPVSSPSWCPPRRTGIAWAADMHAGGDEAEPPLRVRRGAARGGLDVADAVGDPDPLAAIQDECNFHEYDELIVSTLPLTSKWLQLDLPRKAEAATGLPVNHVVGSEA